MVNPNRQRLEALEVIGREVADKSPAERDATVVALVRIGALQAARVELESALDAGRLSEARQHWRALGPFLDVLLEV